MGGKHFDRKPEKHGWIEYVRNLFSKAEPPSIDIDGDFETTIYVYDGRPLKGIKKGDVFYVHVEPRDYILESKATGSTFDTSFGGTAVSYNDAVFGSLGSGLYELKDVARLGYDIKVKAMRTGTYMRGIPQIVSLTADPSFVRDWCRIRLESDGDVPFTEEEVERRYAERRVENRRAKLESMTDADIARVDDAFTLYVDDEDWDGPKDFEGIVRFDFGARFLPVRDGSKAKPHIEIMDGGSRIAECSARNSCYKTLSERITEHPLVASYKECARDGGGRFFVITVVYGE